MPYIGSVLTFNQVATRALSSFSLKFLPFYFVFDFIIVLLSFVGTVCCKSIGVSEKSLKFSNPPFIRLGKIGGRLLFGSWNTLARYARSWNTLARYVDKMG